MTNKPTETPAEKKKRQTAERIERNRRVLRDAGKGPKGNK